VYRILARGERRGLRIGERVYAEDDLLAALDRLKPPRVGFDELGFERAGLNRFDGTAHGVDRGDFRHALDLLPGAKA
jgi:hypothetical protein